MRTLFVGANRGLDVIGGTEWEPWKCELARWQQTCSRPASAAVVLSITAVIVQQ